MTDFAVKISVRNARLLRALQAAGYQSQSQLAAAMGKPLQAINKLFTFYASPLSHGEWSDLAMDISAMLHVEPEDLWPEALKSVRMERNSREILMSSDEVRELAAPREMEIDKAALSKLIAELSPKDQEVVRLRYGLDGRGERLLAEIAALQGVSKDRIRQREQKSLNILRSISRRRHIDLKPE